MKKAIVDSVRVRKDYLITLMTEKLWVDEIVTNELYKGGANKYHIEQWHK